MLKPGACIIDLETTYGKWFNRIANPNTEECKVVICGVKYPHTGITVDYKLAYENVTKTCWFLLHICSVIHIWYFHSALRYDVQVFDYIPEDIFEYKTIVAHNRQFELQWLLKYHKAKFFKWLASGGVMACTQFLQYKMSGHVEKQKSLDQLAYIYGGYTKTDIIKKMWSIGIKTEEVPRKWLEHYNIMDVHNTSIIYERQMKILNKVPQLKKLILYDFMFMNFTGYAEYVGMAVDKKEAELLLERYTRLKEEAFNEVNKIIKMELMEYPFAFDHFDINKAGHISALLFGGEIKYYTYDIILDDTGAAVYYKSGNNKGEARTKKTEKKILLKGICFDDEEKKETKRKGVYKVDAKTLQWMTDIPFISKLLEFRGYEKLINTYLHPNGATILGCYNENTKCVHGNFNHTRVSTGRLSASNPNLQNQESDSDIKTVFISRHKDGYYVEMDWHGLENVTLAIVTQDKNLIKDLNDGIDLHSKRAALLGGYNYEEFIKKVQDNDKEFVNLRKKVKAPSFAYAYGAGVKKLMEATKQSQSEIKAFIEINKQAYPISVSYFDSLHELITKCSTISPYISINGHQLRWYKLNTLLGGVLTFIEQECPVWFIQKEVAYRLGKEHPYYKQIEHLKEGQEARMYPIHQDAIKKGIRFVNFVPTKTKNYPCQNLGAEIVKIFGALLFYKLLNYIDNGSILPVVTVHDQYGFDVIDKKHVDILAKISHHLTQEFPNFLKEYFNFGLNVKLKLDIKYGKNWKEVEPYVY